MEFEITVIGGGYHVFNALNGLAALRGVLFDDLARIGITIGVLWFAAIWVFGGMTRTTVMPLVQGTLILTMLMGPGARVLVADPASQTGYAGTVSGVPWSIAMVGSFTTTVSNSIVDTFTFVMADPGDQTYERHGALVGSTIMSQAARWSAVSPQIGDGLNRFMESCVIMGINLRRFTLTDVATTGDLRNFIDTNVPNSLLVFLPENIGDAGPAYSSCAEAWEFLDAELPGQIQSRLLIEGAKQVGNSTVPYDAAQGANSLSSQIGSFQDTIAMSSTNSTEYLAQAMLLTALDSASGTMIASSGNDAAMSLYQAARTDAQTRASYSATAVSALTWIPMLKVVFFCLYISVVPLLVFLAVTPLGVTVAKSIFGGFVWLASWDPILAVLHSIVNRAASGWYNDAMTVYDGGVAQTALTYANRLGVHAVEQQVGTVAGFMMMSVPFLASALLMGTNKMMGLATSMLNVPQGAAIESGREAATGNVSFGNVAMSNVNANKTNTSRVTDVGRDTGFYANGGSYTMNRDGSLVHTPGSAVSSASLSAGLKTAFSNEAAERSESARRDVQTRGTELMSSISSAAGEVVRSGRSATSTLANATVDERSSGLQDTKRRSEAYTRLEQFAQDNGVDTSTAAAISAMGNLGANSSGNGSGKKKKGGVGKILDRVGISATGQLRLDGNASEQERFSKMLQSAQSQGLAADVALLSGTSVRTSATDGSQTGTSLDASKSSTFDDVRRSADSYRDAVERMDSVSKSNAKVQSAVASQSRGITDVIIEELRKDGFDEAQISRIMNPRTAADHAATDRAVDGIFADIAGRKDIGQMGTVDLGQVTSAGMIPPTMITPPSAAPVDRAITDTNARTGQVMADNGAEAVAITNRAGSSRPLFDRKFGGPNSAQVFHGQHGAGVSDVISNGWQGGVERKLGSAAGMGFNMLESTVTGPYEIAPGVTMNNAGATRNLAIQPAVADTLSMAAKITSQTLGENYTFRVTSGGQPSAADIAAGHTGGRTGSTRHDNGGSADGVLVRNGEVVKPADDRQAYEVFIALAATRMPGIGHYEWGIHVGGGSEAFWGPDKTSKTADAGFEDAFWKGRNQSSNVR